MTSRTIQIPRSLAEDLERRIDDTEFESLDAYVRFVLREIADEDASADERRSGPSEDVEDRLEELGYL